MPITPVGSQRSLLQSLLPTAPPASPSPPEPETPESPPQQGFTRRLTDALQEVNQLQTQADDQLRAVAAGNLQSLPEAVVTMNKADLALQLTIQVTNRAVEAYKQEIQMQI